MTVLRVPLRDVKAFRPRVVLEDPWTTPLTMSYLAGHLSGHRGLPRALSPLERNVARSNVDRAEQTRIDFLKEHRQPQFKASSFVPLPDYDSIAAAWREPRPEVLHW